MEISTGDDVIGIRENQWIVGRGSALDFHDLSNVPQRAEHRPMHLRHTPQAVGVLNARIVEQMGIANLTFGEEVA